MAQDSIQAIKTEFHDVPDINNHIEINLPQKFKTIEEKSDYILLKSITINLEGEWTCSATTFAVFAHDFDNEVSY